MSYELHLGDCLEYMKSMPDKSVDAIITDLPYGTTACSWDVIIPFEPMWEQVKRICKGVFVTTASQPFTSKLIMSNLEMFKYEWIWEKDKPSNFAVANIQPMKYHENVLVFSISGNIYNKQLEKRTKSGSSRCKYIVDNSKRSSEHIILSESPKMFDKNNKNPSSIIKYSTGRRQDIDHPTQKPVALYDYLIRTYTNPDDIVLDICMGSGTTLVAAIQLGRNAIGCEIDPDYFKIAEKRIKEATLQPQLFSQDKPKSETQEAML